MEFKDKIYKIVKNIPKGKVVTYKSIAIAVGGSRAWRGVAGALAQNFDPKIPCHRVVKSDGSLGGYNRGGSKAKESLLKKEGVEIKNSKVDLKIFSCLTRKS